MRGSAFLIHPPLHKGKKMKKIIYWILLAEFGNLVLSYLLFLDIYKGINLFGEIAGVGLVCWLGFYFYKDEKEYHKRKQK